MWQEPKHILYLTSIDSCVVLQCNSERGDAPYKWYVSNGRLSSLIIINILRYDIHMSFKVNYCKWYYNNYLVTVNYVYRRNLKMMVALR